MRNSSFSTYIPPNKLKNRRTPLTPAEEDLFHWKRERGYLEGCMLTISPPPTYRHMADDKLRSIWKEAYIAYGAKHKQKLFFSTVLTHGRNGDVPVSMHIVWQEYPKHMSSLVNWLQENYVTAVTKPHLNGLQYWVHNCSEPDALVEVGQWQLSKEKIRKRAERKRKRVII